MATKKQQQELIDVLKFTPTAVRLMIQGYGGESYAGTVDRKIYDYFASQKIDMGEYAGDWDGVFSENVPDELQPFTPGSPYDCENLWHASGAELTNLNSLTVEDINTNQTIWEITPGWSELEEAGVTVTEFGGQDLEDLPEDTVVFWGGQGEKGCFFDAEFTLRAPFDPSKLVINYENCDGWNIISSVEYDGEELDGTDGYSTTGKWVENKWILCNGEEVYDSVVLEDREDAGLEWSSTPQSACTSEEWNPAEELDKVIDEHMLTDWYDASIKPVRKGMYEVKNTHTPVWPFPASFTAEWSGRSWKDSDGDKVPNVIAWRGMKFDSKEINND